MDERQHKLVQKYRSQIEDLRQDVEKLGEGDKKGKKAADRLHKKCEDYGMFRLREGMGPDPVYVNDDVLADSLRALIRRSKLSTLGEDTPARIGTAARQQLLLSGFSFAESLYSLADGRAGLASLLSERSPVKNAFRRWSEQIADPYIKDTLEQLGRLAENFDHTAILLRKRLDKLRRRYETELQVVDELRVERSKGQTFVRASNDWSNLLANFPDDVRDVYGIFQSLENQLEDIESQKELLNSELRKFMGGLVPIYLAYVQQQSKSGRRSAIGNVKLKNRLVEQMMREAKQTDYLLKGGGLAVPHPRIPREFSALRKLAGYQKFKRSAGIEEMRTANRSDLGILGNRGTDGR